MNATKTNFGRSQVVWFEVIHKTSGQSFGVCATRYAAQKTAKEIGNCRVVAVKPKAVYADLSRRTPHSPAATKTKFYRVIKRYSGMTGDREISLIVSAKSVRGARAASMQSHSGSPVVRIEQIAVRENENVVIKTWEC